MVGQPLTTLHLQKVKKVTKQIKKKLKTEVKLKELHINDIREDVVFKNASISQLALTSYNTFNAKDATEFFNKLEKIGYSKFSFETEDQYGSITVILSAYRMETIDEATKRIKSEKQRKNETKEREYAIYQRLKEKFEPKKP